MQTLTLTRRVVLAVGFLCLVILGLTIFSVTRFRRVEQISTHLERDSIPGMVHGAEIKKAQAESQLRRLQVLLATSADESVALRQEIAKLERELASHLESYATSASSAEDQRLLAMFRQRQAAFTAVSERVATLATTDLPAATALAAGELLPAYRQYAAAADALLQYNEARAQEGAGELAGEVALDIRIVLLAGAVALVLGIAAGVWVIVGLNRTLSATARSLREAAERVAATARQVSGSSQSLATGASEQAAALEETSATLEEVAESSRQNAAGAARATTLAEQTRGAADAGAAKVVELNRAMEAIKGSSQDVAAIIQSIDEIAFQTNLLALNAAVEAARAGEAGAGFAVVAGEVRALAQRAADAARQTATKIEDSLERSARGVAVSSEFSRSLTEILDKARGVEEVVAQIASASSDQTSGLAQVNTALAQMNAVTQRNAASAEESAAAAEELATQAVAQRRAVGLLEKLVFGAQGEPAAAPEVLSEVRETLPAPPSRQLPGRPQSARPSGSRGRRVVAPIAH